MAEHVKVTEEIVPIECMDGGCGHEDDCPLVEIEVCSECREEYDDGDMVTPWAVAEERGHV